jgi:DNA-binding response OmpR family regulator
MRQVYVNGVVVDLTVKEYDILVLLASTPNKVFTKEEIFSRVWGYEVDLDTSTLTVHIRKLREKIEIDPSSPDYIQTVWGVGYKIMT